MKKINVLVMVVALTSRVYASSPSPDYFRGWFGDGDDFIPNLISRRALTRVSVLNPVDNISDLDGRIRLLRLPLNTNVTGENNIFIETFRDNGLIRDEPVGELAHIIELGLNVYRLIGDARNGIGNNDQQYRNRVSIFVNEIDSTIEILLRNDVESTENAKKCIVALICALKRYGRHDIAELLKTEGFF